MRASGLAASLLALSASVSLAAAPVDLPVQAVEYSVLAGSQCNIAGAFGASLETAFSTPGGPSGTLRAGALPMPYGARVDVDGFGSGPAGTVDVTFQIEVDVQIPNVGDAMTPVFVALDPFDHVGPEWRLARASLGVGRITPGCATAEASVTSTFLGFVGSAPQTVQSPAFSHFASYANLASMASPVRATEPQLFVAGDTVRLPLLLRLQLESNGNGDSFIDSLWLTFRTAPPTIGSGDLNGDGQVDVLDATIARRRLAGLPDS